MSRNIQRPRQSTTKDKRLHQRSETATLSATHIYIMPDQAIHNEDETTQPIAQQNRSRRSTRRRNKLQQH